MGGLSRVTASGSRGPNKGGGGRTLSRPRREEVSLPRKTRPTAPSFRKGGEEAPFLRLAASSTASPPPDEELPRPAPPPGRFDLGVESDGQMVPAQPVMPAVGAHEGKIQGHCFEPEGSREIEDLAEDGWGPAGGADMDLEIDGIGNAVSIPVFEEHFMVGQTVFLSAFHFASSFESETPGPGTNGLGPGDAAGPISSREVLFHCRLRSFLRRSRESSQTTHPLRKRQ